MLAFPKNQSILVFLFFPDLAKIEFHEICDALDCVIGRSVAAHCLVVMGVMALSHEYGRDIFIPDIFDRSQDT